MPYDFRTYGLDREEVSILETILPQFVGGQKLSCWMFGLRKVVLHTALPDLSIQTTARVIELDPFDDCRHTVAVISYRFKDTIVACPPLNWVGVNGKVYTNDDVQLLDQDISRE